MRMTVYLLAVSTVLVACSDSYTPGILYQAKSPACAIWSDGSRFELPKEIDVFAGKPESGSASSVDLSLAYFIPPAAAATFTNQVFAIAPPQSAETVRGTVTSIEQAVSPVRAATTVALATLPDTLRAQSATETTMYRIKIRFSGPIPDRFDFTPPRMLIGQDSYPVRTYTYRFFPDRKAYGLCT